MMTRRDPLGEHAAHHHRGLLRRHRRRRRGRRAAVHRGARPCRTALRGGSRATPNSSCWRSPTWRRVADPAAGSGGIEELTDKARQRRLGAVPGDRARRRRACSAGKGSDPGRRSPRSAPEREAAVAQPQGRADRHQRLSELSRKRRSTVLDVEPVTLAARIRPRFAIRALPPMRLAEPFERLRDSVRPHAVRDRQHGRRSSSPISARLPSSPRARPSPRTSSRPAASRRSPATASPDRDAHGRGLQGIGSKARLPVLERQGL